MGPRRHQTMRDLGQPRAAARAAAQLSLPMTVKEQFDVLGCQRPGASRFRDWRPDVDALAMQRLKGAGAMFICEINIR